MTRSVATMELVELPEPGSLGPAESVVRPQAVGIRGSDIHLFDSHLGARG